MIKGSAVFKDIKNCKKTQTVPSLATSRDFSKKGKQLSRPSSIKQINLNGYIENKYEKIKDIDVRLEVHQEEINKNSQIIEQLHQNYINLKKHLDKEKENCANEQKKNKKLSQEIEKITKLLNLKTTKVQQYNKRIADILKENDILKIQNAKCEEYLKTIAILKNKIVIFQQSSAELKRNLTEKQRYVAKCKQKVATFDNVMKKEEERNEQIACKDQLIGSLRQAIDELNIEKISQFTQKQKFQDERQKLHQQIEALNKLNTLLKSQKNAQEKKLKQFNNKIAKVEQSYKESLLIHQSRYKEQASLKREINELKISLDEQGHQLNNKIKQITKKDFKLQTLHQKYKQLQKQLGQSYKERERLKSFSEKAQAIKQRLQNLQSLYKIISPQVQCPFGHELDNPVTVIPCGHNYCHGCKQGYEEQCTQCGGMFKIEAVYRNQLMDDIIGMVATIRQIIEILK